MYISKHRVEAKHAVVLLSAVLFVACASVLGIEERSLDVGASYPANGYEGCRPSSTCGDCLEVHRMECDVRSSCADTSGLGECASCVCDNCLEAVVECRSDAGCNAIWQCLQQSRCDVAGSGAGSCRDACADVIDANGGLSGEAFRDAAAIRTCAITESCLGCLPPERDVPPRGCSTLDGCVGCTDCFQQCLCSGDTFSVCQQLCGAEAPPEACSSEDRCAGCTSCFQVCACQGATFDHCTASCQETTPACDEQSCDGCVGCLETCLCEGGDSTQCQQSCALPPATGSCREGSSGRGGPACDGCTSCLATCTCNGAGLEGCLDTCGMLSCCEGGGDCPGFYADCICGATEPSESCAERSYGCSSAFGCDQCVCGSCNDKYIACEESAGCGSIFECMRATNCSGGACLDRCGNGESQTEQSDGFALAEALWACSQGAGCECEHHGSPVLSCGTASCTSHVTDDGTLDACCPNAVGQSDMGASSAPAGGTDGCGLSLQGHFPYAPACLPMNQPNQPLVLPELLIGCPAGRIDGPPYHGARLEPCCNKGSGSCGYWDDVTGLGCVDSSVFSGVQGAPCN